MPEPEDTKTDINDALTKVMRIFWSRGYRGTSVDDLASAINVDRARFRDLFGCKRTAFLHALDHYEAVHLDRYLGKLRAMPNAYDAVVGAFDAGIATVLDRGNRDGCLYVNTAMELSAHDPEVAGMVRHGLVRIEEFFQETIEAGQRTGELPRHLNPVRVAQSLLCLFVGTKVLSRSRPEEHLLRTVSAQAAALLE